MFASTSWLIFLFLDMHLWRDELPDPRFVQRAWMRLWKIVREMALRLWQFERYQRLSNFVSFFSSPYQKPWRPWINIGRDEGTGFQGPQTGLVTFVTAWVASSDDCVMCELGCWVFGLFVFLWELLGCALQHNVMLYVLCAVAFIVIFDDLRLSHCIIEICFVMSNACPLVFLRRPLGP